MTDIINKLKIFHGIEYSEGPWDSKDHDHCNLCKTRSVVERHQYWANGLCRSCYRRLSPKHRQYNDEWSDKKSNRNLKKIDTIKKEYKNDDISNIKFSQLDIDTLLERYDFKCAYCRDQLQVHDMKKCTFMHIEYLKVDNGLYELVPICKSCSCSKKNLQNDYDLKMWALERRIQYPFIYKNLKN